MKFLSGLLLTAACLPTLAFAKTNCGGRIIEIVELEQGKKAPCEVRYTKPENEAKVVFSAKNDESYCSAKAAEFVESLKGKGLDCKDE
ncbi:MAG: hypothetical protein AAB250_02295 [Bdellovibrionota bacterium]